MSDIGNRKKGQTTDQIITKGRDYVEARKRDGEWGPSGLVDQLLAVCDESQAEIKKLHDAIIELLAISHTGGSEDEWDEVMGRASALLPDASLSKGGPDA